MKRSKTTKVFYAVFLTIILLIIYAPIMSLVLFSFNNSRSVINFTGFTLKNYLNIFSSDIGGIILTTFIVASISTIVSTVIGTFASISLSTTKKRIRNTVFSLNDLPIVNPDIITAIGLFLLFGAFHIRSESGYLNMILAHVAFSVPYVLITIYPKVSRLDPNISEASKDLGANNIQTLFLVIIPQIKDVIIGAAAIAFTMSFDDFVISYFAVGDSGLQNISIYLYTLRRGVNPAINALTTLMILVIIAVVVVNQLRLNKKNRRIME